MGPDGALWFTEGVNYDEIGQITTEGAITRFPLLPGSSPQGIATGPDGALWFTEQRANKIGRITPAGSVTEFPIPTAASFPRGIAAGPDGALWFTEANKIGHITTDGAITEFDVPSARSNPLAITAGPDGAMWFTEEVGNKIGRITTPAPPVPTSKRQCKRGGWRDFSGFKNQGRCIAFVKRQARQACVAERAKIGRPAFRAKYGKGNLKRRALRRCIRLTSA